MKIQELINELEKIKLVHPDADITFERLEYQGNGYSHTPYGIVDCRWEGRHAQIRVASPLDVDKLKELIQAQNDQA